MDSEQFGPNTWLIEEMYRQYSDDPSSVSETWREFFRDYKPPGGDGQAEPETAPVPREAPPREPPARAPRPPARAPSRARPPTPPEPAPSREQEGPGEAEEGAADQAAESTPLRGVEGVIARRMEESLTVPTATSVRTLPAKLLEVNRNILNRHLARSWGAKVSFTHLIGWAVVRALREMPGMRVAYQSRAGRPHLVRQDRINLGLAVDVKREDGTRVLLVPTIKDAGSMDFQSFFLAYEELIRKVQANKLSPDDFAGTTHTITNPGMIGTVQSVPRLMAGQSAIFGVGAIGHPAEWEGSDPRTLAEMGVGKVITITSTYDHRVIQGAESGEFLARVHGLLLGEDGFYEGVFAATGVPYVPVVWRRDVNPREESLEWEEKQARVLQLINAHRVRGHLIAPLDPLSATPPSLHPELDPATYGFTIWDLDRPFVTGGLAGRKRATLGEILALLRDAYCRSGTVEYMHIQEPDQKRWIQDHVEGVSTETGPEDRRRILRKLNEAEAFERFLHQKFIGHKRFSLEGAESLVPVLDAILDQAADAGLDEVVIGMAHRGRLNVLANVIGKNYTQIFREFEGDIDPDTPQGSGDVKYHLGANGKHTSRAGRTIALTLASNPSHLEAVDPVVEGMVRAKQDVLDRGLEYPVMPLLIHGDAAFAGQGVVAETLNISQLRGYRTGGTVHVIVNNQLGFTTGWQEARSSTYASDVAKMIQAPIFHVNGDDPEACVRVARLAFEFARAFDKDVVIDMWCYRRWGHNEGDDPSITQPLMYERIQNRRSVRKLYTEALVNRGDLSLEDAEGVLQEFQEELKRAFDETRQPSSTPAIEWKRPSPLGDLATAHTGTDRQTLDRVVEAITTLPEGFALHQKLGRWVERRRAALAEDRVDWSLAEALAFGVLLMEGRTVRLSGEDTRRGTFSHRHAVLVDRSTGDELVPLQRLAEGGKFFIYDSLLSEFAAVGFEYGYSVGNPDALVCWEAQFGDFVNGAQVIIDQFLAAAEDKWGQTSRLALLLPHGYEGQGPEHSSARLERFLTDAAEDNYQVAVPTTPAQYYHLLRRHAHLAVPKPLVCLTPKSLLRHPAAQSNAGAFTDAGFAAVLDDPEPPSTIERLVLCAGKVWYDLADRRREEEIPGAALVRIEQLYPFPAEELRGLVGRSTADEIVWVQEEPENMGAWRFVRDNLERAFGVRARVVAREESASPSTGSLRIHQREQTALLDRAFAGLKDPA